MHKVIGDERVVGGGSGPSGHNNYSYLQYRRPFEMQGAPPFLT
jgi:hypothetical protein